MLRQTKAKEVITTRSALQEMLNGVFQDEKKRMLISDMKTYECIQHTGKGK